MNFNVWNIKEMFSTPTASKTNKSSSRSSAPSDYSSLSDSQFLFGSQFCPENSQSAPVPLECSAQSRQQKSSQQNSQDSEPSIFTKYQTKPQLFGGDEKEKNSFNFGVGKLKNVLEQFEVNKKKVKDKHDSEVLSTFISSVKESIQGLQTCLDKFEGSLDSRNKSILDGLEAISKTLQETAQSHYESVLNALTDKSQTEQVLLEMERRLAAKDMEILDVKSNLQLLKESLELLTSQQNKQHQKLCEQLNHLPFPNILAELQTFISTSRFPSCIKDNASQTSPDILQDLCLTSQEKTCCQCYQTMRVCRTSSFQTQLHTMTMANRHGNSHMRNHIAKDDSNRTDLNTVAGRKVNLTTTALQGKENMTIQEMKSGLEKQPSANNPPCACCSNTDVFGDSHEKHQLLTQEIPQATPLRMVIRKDSKGIKTITPSQQNQSQLCQPPAQNNMAGRDKDFATDNMMHITVVGNGLKKEKSKKLRRSKLTVRKRMYVAKKKGDLSKCPDSGLNQKMTSRWMELEDSRKNYSPTDTVTLHSENSGPGSSAPSHQKLSRAQHGKKENSLAVLHSHENLERLAAKRKGILESKRRVDICNTKGTLCFWDCSPRESDIKGEKRMSWFTLPSTMASNKSCLSFAPAQHKNPTFCSLVFDSDYSD
ncbi:interactor of HORMAD1 protein 1 isoform X1 [Gopherus evgoodei]|uniref:interactor of HORMAD1 protein 1 isoform X1 n=1 Tax=Gopherus evgoodei TaxID=1825980 RepID=UPI0011CF2AEE|nr:interactor of HORMAD1 protein 1 isoform X1 [Gopherus evgoodei]XP_030425613.1 interactor of HORMAD1 protein 1 isoform X1 [Gopherus evgoodei]